MSWYDIGKSSGRSEGYNSGRAAVLQELRDKEGKEISSTKRACLDELSQHDPKNVFYSGNLIRDFLADFYKAARRVSLHELCNIWRPKDEGVYKKLEADFKAVDVTGDQALSLAEFFILGFLGDDRKEGYKLAKKVDS